MLYCLFESSLGFSLFKVNNWDKLSTQGAKLQDDMQNFQSFKKMASLEHHFFFQGHNVAYENLSKLREGELSDELADFLRTNLPSGKKVAFQLSVQDKTLATAINTNLKIKCVSGEAFNEIFRSIRTHLGAFLSGTDGWLIRNY